jgi:uncharacterized membrane protein
MSALSWLVGGWRPGAGELHFGASELELGLAAAGVALLLLLSWLTARGVRRRGLQVLLLLPVAAALLWSMARPTWVQRDGSWEEGRFVVLVDDSRSMGVREGEALRSAAVPDVLAAIGRPDAERFRFGSSLAPGEATSFGAADTDLGLALRSLSERYAGERLAGIAVITDGVDRGAWRQAWLAGEPLELPALPGPLSLYGVGRSQALVDLSVASVASGGFAFIRTPLELRATIQGSGYAGHTVPVTLTRDGSLVERQQLGLDDAGRGEVTFRVTPTEVGRHAFRVEVPIDADDAVPANNTATVVVRVVRDRMRVLQVCGSPSMDQKFLRRFLKQDPAVDLVSFFILRTHDDMGSGYDEDELALIPFPYRQLFTDDLWSFDLVIFQNFDYEPYFGWQGGDLLENLADWVKAGGAFVMVGGDRSFDLGAYGGTALEDVLPVQLGMTLDQAASQAAFTPKLTTAGRFHPATALASDLERSEALWAGLAPLDGLNLSRGLAPGATALLRHPEIIAADGAGMPVVAVRNVGEGRALALTADSSWRWAFAEAGKGRGNQAYLRFWKHAMRWLVGDPDAQRVTVSTSRENYGLGDEVRAVVRVRDPAFQPQAGVTVRGRVLTPDLSTALEAELVDDQGRFQLVTDAAGNVELLLPASSSGSWHLDVQALDSAGEPFFEGGTVYAVTEREPELEEVIPDLAFLEALAEATAGAYHPPGSPGTPLEDPDSRRRIEAVSETSLWDVPLVAILIGLFAPLSWFVRRRGGGR